MQQRRRAEYFRLAGIELLLHAQLFSTGDGRVQLHQHLAGLHGVTVFDQHAAHHTGFQRLDEFGALADDDAPGGHSHNIYLADDGPDQRDGEQGDDAKGKAPGRGVHRGLLQAQGSGQKGGFIGQAPGACEFGAVGPGGTEDGFVAGEQVKGGVLVMFGVVCICGHGTMVVSYQYVISFFK